MGAGDDRRHGRARREREPEEVALTLRALYGVESNLRLEGIRDVSERVRALSGDQLEPWKPVSGETLFRRESGAVASQFHDPLDVPEERRPELLARVKELGSRKHSLVTDAEFRELAGG